MASIDLFDLGLHDYLCTQAQALVGTGSAVPPGVWIGSAEFISRLGRGQHSGQFIRQRIRKLKRLGWLRTFKISDTRYAFLINRFAVRDVNGVEYRLNAEATINWRQPVLE